ASTEVLTGWISIAGGRALKTSRLATAYVPPCLKELATTGRASSGPGPSRSNTPSASTPASVFGDRSAMVVPFHTLMLVPPSSSTEESGPAPSGSQASMLETAMPVTPPASGCQAEPSQRATRLRTVVPDFRKEPPAYSCGSSGPGPSESQTVSAL